MPTSAHAATLFGAEDLRVVERPLGPLADGMVRIKLRAGGICGTDLHYFRHGRTGDFVLREPLVLGHELAGEIVDTEAPDTGLTVGDHVAINPSRRCNTCPRCREGRSNLCENIFFMGSASKNPHMQGGFSTYFDTTPGQCIVVPKSVPMSAIAMAEPLAVCLHAVSRAGNLVGKNIAIFGGGPIGLLTLLAAQVAGIASATMVDIADRPLVLARSLGANQTFNTSTGADALVAAAAGAPFDTVFEVTGALPALSLAIRTVRRGGAIVQVGNLPGGDVSLSANLIMTKELDYRGTMRFHDEFDKAVELIVSGAVDVQKIITGSRPIEQALDAFHLAFDRSQSIKVVLEAM